jgi:TolB-like protein/tetratricopeptide (TPR) repeat protein
MNELQPPLLATTWAELRRRRVVRALLVYLVVAWGALQVADVTFEPLGLPTTAMTWAVLVAIVGLPVTLVFAWAYDVGSGGIERDRRGASAPVRRLAFAAMASIALVGLVAWAVFVYRPNLLTDDTGRGDAIAVLPFDDLSADGDQRYFADGIAEELLDRLARVPGLKVAARTSSFAFRDASDDVRRIGEVLGVDYVLDGSVRKADGRVRISVSLVDARKGFALWSETYERPDRDVFAVQDEITGAIVGELGPQFADLAPIASAAASGPRIDVLAHELYLRGRLKWRERTADSLTAAAGLFQQAIERQPDYAAAHAGLADTWLLLADYGGLPLAEALRRAEPEAVRAIELDPESGETWATLGLLRMSSGQYDAAESSFRRAIRLDPLYEMAPTWLARTYLNQERLREAREVLERAREINPLEPIIVSNYIEAVLAEGRVDDARRLHAEVAATLPDNAVLRRTAQTIEIAAGDFARAWELASAGLLPGLPPADVLPLLGIAFDAGVPDVLARLATLLPEAHPLRPVVDIALASRTAAPTPLTAELAARVEQVRTAREPLDDTQRSLLGVALQHALTRGDDAAAAGLLDALDDPERAGEPAAEQWLALAVLRAALGDADGAQRDREAGIAAIAGRERQGYANARTLYARACAAAVTGETDAAFVQLDAAITAGLRDEWALAHDPCWRGLRADPRHAAVVARVAALMAPQREAIRRSAAVLFAGPAATPASTASAR